MVERKSSRSYPRKIKIVLLLVFIYVHDVTIDCSGARVTIELWTLWNYSILFNFSETKHFVYMYCTYNLKFMHSVMLISKIRSFYLSTHCKRLHRLFMLEQVFGFFFSLESFHLYNENNSLLAAGEDRASMFDNILHTYCFREIELTR